MKTPTNFASTSPIGRLLVANRSEIAIRIFRAATELGIRTFAVYAEEDKLSLHRFKADEAYLIGRGKGPLEAYLSIDEVVRVAKDHRIDAIHPGYGFLSESPEFAEACARENITFIGPSPTTMRTLGNKVAARNLAISCGVPVMPASEPLSDDPHAMLLAARTIGYPLMIKASWGGGGRGMRPIDTEDKLVDAVGSAKREAYAAFGKGEVYLEKLVRQARHVEVQILGDNHGNIVHLFERDCSVQHRNQKIIERAPAPYLDEATREALCAAALKIGQATNYAGAGTVEFLMDMAKGQFYFIEVNPQNPSRAHRKRGRYWTGHRKSTDPDRGRWSPREYRGNWRSTAAEYSPVGSCHTMSDHHSKPRESVHSRLWADQRLSGRDRVRDSRGWRDGLFRCGGDTVL